MILWLMVACPSPAELPPDPPPADTQVEELPEEICDDGADNDGDGDVDCLDNDCAALEICDEICDDGVDNDGDTRIDCADGECKSHTLCLEDCIDGVDNDLDGGIDCADSDCWSDPVCAEDCSDGVDNDLDGNIDCADLDCWGETPCLEDCFDGVDNDLDGLLDCEDSYCTELCSEPSCSDGIDGDDDGFMDCEDEDCWGRSPCGHTLWFWPRDGSFQGTMESWDYTDPAQMDRVSHHATLSGLSGRVGISAFHQYSFCDFRMDSLVASEVQSASAVHFQLQANNFELSGDCELPFESFVLSGSGTDLGLRFDGPQLALSGNQWGLIYAYSPDRQGSGKNTSALRFRRSTMNFNAYSGNIWRQEVPGP
jgi:hypothetical protein